MKILPLILTMVPLVSFAMDLKGARPGMSKQELDAMFPNLACELRSSQELESRCETNFQGRATPVLETLAGVKVQKWSFEFHDNRLDRVSLFFDAENFEVVEKALTTKYGKPGVARSAVQNIFGATFEQRAISWRQGKDEIVGFRFLGTHKTSGLVLTGSEGQKRIDEKAKGEAARRAKDL